MWNINDTIIKSNTTAIWERLIILISRWQMLMKLWCAALNGFFFSSWSLSDICLPLVSTFEESPLAKDKERDLSLCVAEPFSCGLIYARNDWPGGLFSPSQAKHWSWLMDRFVQSLLGVFFGGGVAALGGLTRRWEGFSIFRGETFRRHLHIQQLKTQLLSDFLFFFFFLFDKCVWLAHRALRFGSCPVLKTWVRLSSSHCEVLVSLKAPPPFFFSPPSGCERSAKFTEVIKFPLMFSKSCSHLHLLLMNKKEV